MHCVCYGCISSETSAMNGSCLCGGVVFQTNTRPAKVMVCYCNHCAKNAGAPGQYVRMASGGECHKLICGGASQVLAPGCHCAFRTKDDADLCDYRYFEWCPEAQGLLRDMWLHALDYTAKPRRRHADSPNGLTGEWVCSKNICVSWKPRLIDGKGFRS